MHKSNHILSYFESNIDIVRLCITINVYVTILNKVVMKQDILIGKQERNTPKNPNVEENKIKEVEYLFLIETQLHWFLQLYKADFNHC